LVACQKQPEIALKEIQRLPIPNPTGIAYRNKDSNFYVVNSDGIIARLNKKFELLEKFEFPKYSFNAVYLDEANIYLLTSKSLLILEQANLKVFKDLSLVGLVGSKVAFNTIFFNPFSRAFVIISNGRKTKLIELDPIRFKIIRRLAMKDVQFVSGGTVLGNYLCLLNNTNGLLYKLNLKENYRLESTFRHSVYDASNLAFAEGIGLVIVSKELRRAFIFDEKSITK
jgi:hypothetical protein